MHCCYVWHGLQRLLARTRTQLARALACWATRLTSLWLNRMVVAAMVVETMATVTASLSLVRS
jgi:hypothetical protein